MTSLSSSRIASPLDRAALLGIDAYRRVVSPRKGFACAHRVARGTCSCSSFGRRIVARRGVVRGLPLLRARLAACGRAAAELRALHAAAAADPRARRRGRTPGASRSDRCADALDVATCFVPIGGCGFGACEFWS